MNTHDKFIYLFSHTRIAVQFKPKWANGTGYLDGICREDELIPPGMVGKTVDNHNRRVLILGTEKGPVAVFERYANGGSGFLVANFPNGIRRYDSGLGQGEILEEHLDKMFYISNGVTRNQIDDFAVLYDYEEEEEL